jgi:4'-phosphopantetheinyl transferase EntD
VIERILPAGVAAAWTTTEIPDAVLFPEEEDRIRGAVESRRREFATGRHCARLALARLGLPATAIPAGPRGEPLWPDGVTGSITHCAGYRAAVAARRAQVRSIGIDAEAHLPLPAEIRDMVLLPEEREHIDRLSSVDADVHWPMVVFSAKEALYKSWFALTERWLGFHDAELRLDPEGAFTIDIRISATAIDGTAPPVFEGRWHTDGNIIVTAVSSA